MHIPYVPCSYIDTQDFQNRVAFLINLHIIADSSFRERGHTLCSALWFRLSGNMHCEIWK